MEFLINNWYIGLAFVAICTVAIYYLIVFCKQPSKKKVENVKQWLRFAVMQCEKELGTKTGQAKLAMCYDLAVSRFGWIATMVSFETFSSWVDEALEWLNKQLESNGAIQSYVGE